VTDQVFSAIESITDEEIARVREMIGEPVRLQQYCSEASLDTIRHFAMGVGDENPLWCDEEYAAVGPYEGIVAPPLFPYSIFAPGVTPGFGGLQVFFGTAKWTFQRPIRRGEKVSATARMTDLSERQGRTASRMLVQESRTDYAVDDEVVATVISEALRVQRAAVGGGLQYAAREPYQYSERELEDIERQTLGRQRRGDSPRYYTDVEVGESLPALVKGPLDLTTIICFYSTVLPFGYAPCDTQWRHRHLAKTDPDRLPNNRDVAWVAERTWPGIGHFQAGVAAAVGMPGAYDNGWMRTTWLSQVVTDWMGDAGVLVSFSSRLRRPNLMGDTTWFQGEVTSRDDRDQIVGLGLKGYNQLGDLTCEGQAFVRLPAPPL
jgi:acyl dehydratase